MILLAVCTSNFFHSIFLCMARVLFTAFSTCLSPSTGFPVVSKFLTFKAPQGSWDILHNSFKTIADLHLFWSSGLIKCYVGNVGLNSLFTFSDGDSFYICNSLFPQGWCYLVFCSQCQLSTPDNSLGSVEFLMLIHCVWSYEWFLFLICFLPVSGCLPRHASYHSLFSKHFSD